MKKPVILSVLICFLLSIFAVSAETETVELLTEVSAGASIQRMIWSADGSMLTLVSPTGVDRYYVNGEDTVQRFAAEDPAVTFITVSEDGLAAALSADRKQIFLYEPDSLAKAALVIQPGFETLSVSLSEDGSSLLTDSAEEIRTVVYDTSDGSLRYDLQGFNTAAPVYDSTLSRDGKYIVWHARGTLAVQNTADGSFGETVSLWDFISAYELSPDNKTLAVGIIGEDYDHAVLIFFDPQSAQETGRVDLEGKTAAGLSYSADGSVLWTADSQNVYRIDGSSYEPIGQVSVIGDGSEDRIIRIAAAPDGNTAAVLTAEGDIYLIR